MRDITLMPNDYIVTHVKTDTICEHFSNDDVVYVVEERVVPLVRCGECKHRLYCCRGDIPMSDRGFCSYGERSSE